MQLWGGGGLQYEKINKIWKWMKWWCRRKERWWGRGERRGWWRQREGGEVEAAEEIAEVK